MSLKKSEGNMYPWVTHTHAHLGGECPHKCSYCYVDNPRFGRPEKYTGDVRLIEDELKVNYGKDRIIFVENCNDMLAEGVPDHMIMAILHHCHHYPDNTYVFQSKNPRRFHQFHWPKNSIFGTTIETNKHDLARKISKAPAPVNRQAAMASITDHRKFLTIEPIMDFDIEVMVRWILEMNVEFVNIGADSKNHGLKEPSAEKVTQLVDELIGCGIEIRQKHNLERRRIR